MGKYYIGGVANVSAFKSDADGNLVHFFDAKTLTDSSINVSVSSEEIRGGEGAQLLGKFFHTTVFNLSLTDALFDLNYIATQVGSEVDAGDTSIVRKYNLNDGYIIVKNGIPSLPFDSMYEATYIAWDDENNQYTLKQDITDKTKYQVVNAPASLRCVNVLVTQSGLQVKVKSMYTPGVMSLKMEAKLFSGDACKASDGKAVGKVVIDIPKFQLDGAIDLAMAMTSPATFAMNGSALANGCGCDGDMWYAKITNVEFATSNDPYGEYNGIIIDGNYLGEGETIGVYAFAAGKTPKQLAVGQYYSNNPSLIANNGVVVADNTSGYVTITANAVYTFTQPNGVEAERNSAIFGKTDTVFINTITPGE